MNKLLPVVLVASMAINSFLGVRGTDYDVEENVSVSTEVITDAELIRQMALEDGIDPGCVAEIVVEKYEFDNTLLLTLDSERDIVLKEPDLKNWGTFYTHVDNWQCLGEYYYPSEEKSDYIDGPASVSTSYSVKTSAKITSGLSIESKYVKAQFGVELGKDIEYSKEISVSVPANQTVNVKYYPNYKKWTYDVYSEYSENIGLWYYQGQGTVMIPCGIIVRQYRINK